MAQCEWCEKKGLFLKVNEYGLCHNCSALIIPVAQQVIRIMEESTSIIEKTKKYDVAISRCDLIKEKLELLVPYEKKGICFFNKSIEDIKGQFVELKNEKRFELIEPKIKSLVQKANTSTTIGTKTGNFNKAIVEIEEKIDLFDDRHINYKKFMNELTEKRNEYHNQILKIKYNDFIENGKKEEFKENTKKALDKYLEALYLLENNKEFTEIIGKNEKTELEKKVTDLRK